MREGSQASLVIKFLDHFSINHGLVLALREKLGFLQPRAKVRSPGPSPGSLRLPLFSWLFGNQILSQLSEARLQKGKGPSACKHMLAV